MSSEKTKWWKTPPYSNIVGGLSVLIIAGLAKSLYEWITFPTRIVDLSGAISVIVQSFRYIFNIEIRIWQLIIFILSIIAAERLFSLYHKYLNNRKHKVILKKLELELKHQKDIGDAFSKRNKSVEFNSIQPQELSSNGEVDIPMEALERMSDEIDKSQAKEQESLKKMLDFTAEKIDGIVWNWDWIYNHLLKRYEPKNIRPICPNQLCFHNRMQYEGRDFEFNIHRYKCNKCQRTLGAYNEPSDIETFLEKRFFNPQ